jgi:2-phosphosulfolactate phosphatase
LVNASAMAIALGEIGRDVTLLCAGTNGAFAPEDFIGAGAVAHELLLDFEAIPDVMTRQAAHFFLNCREDLPRALRATQGGKNIIAAGLEPDIDFAARLRVFDIVVEVCGDPPVAARMIEP